MRTRPHLIDQVAGADFYEPPGSRPVRNDDFVSFALRELPPAWQQHRSGMWYYCTAPSAPQRRHGWKIHLSATLSNAGTVLAAVLPVLRANGVSFKFTVDRDFLRFSLSKTWARGGSGKFITAYPNDDDQFVVLMEALHTATAGLEGPYILSDRRYKDNQVLYYRYGSIVPLMRLRADGTRVGVLDGPDGSEVVDERTPYFAVPAWARDPFPTDAVADEGEPGTLGGGRYKIESAITFSNSGGVFTALDRHSGAKVVIKEARPLVSWTASGDARSALRREYRILRKLSGTGVAPEPVDYFTDWEHEFLVEEFVEGTILHALTAIDPILMRTRPSEAEWEAWYASFRDLFTRVADALRRVHERGVLLLDLAPSNVMVTAGRGVKLIDFEAAIEAGTDAPTELGTPGFRAQEKLTAAVGTREADYFSLGAVVLSQIFPLSGVFELAGSDAAALVSEVCRTARVPQPVAHTIAAALGADPGRRTTPEAFAAVLAANPRLAPPRPQPGADETASRLRAAAMRDRVLDYIVATATPGRDDRLFPSDFRLFRTNRLSLAYGAAGTLAALRRTGRALPSSFEAWLTERLPEADGFAPGLGVGRAGVAWALAELGWDHSAERLMRRGAADALGDASPGLFAGAAGWGLANLRFFLATQDEAYLAEAIAAAERLAERARRDDAGRPYWTQDGSADGPLHYGLYHGGAGVALFLLYLALATDQLRFLALGQNALDFEIARKQTTRDGGAVWHYARGHESIIAPYWEYGAAGVGAAVLRYGAVTGDPRYRDLYEEIFVGTDVALSYLPGKQTGLAGIGGAHLDAFRLTGDPRYRTAACKALEGIALSRLERPEGLAFPGSVHTKISSDWGYGLAGIALFLDRLATGAPAEFLLDEYLLRAVPPTKVPA